jgi:hypothetical protein
MIRLQFRFAEYHGKVDRDEIPTWRPAIPIEVIRGLLQIMPRPFPSIYISFLANIRRYITWSIESVVKYIINK